MIQNYSEKILAEMVKISERDRVPLFEACVTYCEEHDMDTEELCHWLDDASVRLLRQSALDSNRVRKCVGVPESALQFE